ncbi:MAG: beta-lactamase domain protein [Frankiales bacterium]|jgi:glyoxylase-like metal-dependent hydrolase (beta-lactamase superfamily II)|nr:beta-lactamase domain protein [Frankiales bacterium]
MTAVQLATGIWRIPTVRFDLVNSFLIADDDGSLTLVDAGLKRAEKKVLAALASLGKAPQDVQRIVLTHAHQDHAGGLAGAKAATGANVLAHDRDAVYLQSGKPPQLDHSRLSGRLMNRVRGGFGKVDVGETFQDGELLPIGGGLRVVHTAGHSPGHVSLLHEPTGVLITGDAIFNVRGLRYSPATFCTDIRLSRETAHRLGELEYDVAAFTHGAHISDGAREAVRAFLRGRSR